MRPHNKTLFLALTLVLAVSPACSTRALPEQKVEARTTEAQAQQAPAVVAAIVKAKKANLRNQPSPSAAVVGTVNKDDLLSLTNTTPNGPWYQIRDSKTGTRGWIHGDTIALLQIADANVVSTTAAQRPRTVATPDQAPRTASTPELEPRASSTPVETLSTTSPVRSYVNRDGIRVQSPTFRDTKPAGASARCRDGSYSFSLNRRGTCSHHGGVAEWY